MIRFRPFLNSDPPALARIWCSQPPIRGLVQPITPLALEELVFSKPYFDRHGLILAIDEYDREMGFVHAGFGPTPDGSRLDYGAGVTCLLMVGPEGERFEIASGLLAESERYLEQRGAWTLYGGCRGRLAPFYHGLYGGSLPPGVLKSDSLAFELYQARGYEASGTSILWQRELAGFRRVVDRDMIRLRRRCKLARVPENLPENWWEACTTGQLDKIQFELRASGGGDCRASVCFWDVEPLASTWRTPAVGMLDLQVEEPNHQSVLATFTLGEALRELHSYGAALAEVQTDADDEALIETCQRLGFHEVDRGVQFRKAAV